ncbi:MAG TPA: hypothetical protein VNZ26_28740, partial [Vicinamibacterales bacterium]|nr:hypothetical protein [Vicinamibacterales bacterium]
MTLRLKMFVVWDAALLRALNPSEDMVIIECLVRAARARRRGQVWDADADPWHTSDMRRLVVALALMSACANPTSPSPTLTGTWGENFAIPGASLTLIVDASGNGHGTYAIEAGRSGVIQVVGTAVQSMVT